MGKKGKDRRSGDVAKLPKKKCCVSSTKCNRCPLRMLKEGTLPDGYTVKKRRLVKADPSVPDLPRKDKKSKKGKKSKKRALEVAA